MKFTDNALNILAAKTYKGIGKAWIVKHAKTVDSVEKLVKLLNDSSKEEQHISLSDFDHRKHQIRKQLEQFTGIVDGVVAIGDKLFPQYRGVVKNSEQPVALFYRGNLRLLDQSNNNIAVIGLLNPDEQTISFEKKVVSHLVSLGATIVSGLALGCDSVAHKQALIEGGKTIAILPGPITDILPHTNRDLAEDIVQHDGLLISEYADKAGSKMELSGRYIERDRLQALFSDCVILTASYTENDLGLDSGSRHAMNYASNYAIPRAVMYDDVIHKDNPTYDLNRRLIKDDSTITVINSDTMSDILQHLVSPSPNTPSWVQSDLFS